MRVETESMLRARIRDVPDYPKPGIMFRDVTPLLGDATAFGACIDEMASIVDGKRIGTILGIEARGFILGGALAYKLGIGFVPARKKGKLPREKIEEEYGLEYGKDAIEVHKDAITPGENVLIVDDLLATGGTADAAARLVRRLGGTIAGFVFVIELKDLNGRKRLEQYGGVYSIVKY